MMRKLLWGLTTALLVLAGCGEGADVVLKDSVDSAPEEVAIEITPELVFPEVTVEVGPDLPAIDEVTFELLPETTEDLGVAPGEAGYPCFDTDDCNSGFCIQTPQGKQCTMGCVEECPFDWVCVQHQPSLPDEVFICVPMRMNLCKPCQKNSDCLTNGAETGATCLPYGAPGDFCGSSCMGDADCPSDYECQKVLDIWGYESNQCVLPEGTCPCEPWFVDEGASTLCENANENGVCEGQRHCTVNGLTDCDAPQPAAESCNDTDDDCDGEIDENAGGDTCFVENQWGACKGTYLCSAGNLNCDATEPGAEICDGKDNDCDSTTDEGFPDSDQDGMADCLENDKDGDGILDIADNCPNAANSDQKDTDLDMAGDACDPDDDNDQVGDADDCAPLNSKINPEAEEVCDGLDNDCNGMVDEGFADSDADGLKNCIDDDDDNDGFDDQADCAPTDPSIYPGAEEICDGKDNDCDFDSDEQFPDTDQDGLADCVDKDIDGDGLANLEDNCPAAENPQQEDFDQDGLGDACDPDLDGDGIADALDNCPGLFNPGQKDLDEDGTGDDCDDDVDGDGLDEADDNCPLVANPQQEDQDEDGTGDACDNDLDGDGDPDNTDCEPTNPYVSNQANEICDGMDNDCSGIADEGFQDTDFDGLKDCVDPDDDNDGDSDVTDCKPLNPQVFNGADEVCNGTDDDCDNEVDEDTGTLACGKGACFHTIPMCDNGFIQVCDPTAGAKAEICDNLDNDCDGIVDEDLGWETCGTGACLHTVLKCIAGQPADCDPMAGATDEKCDGMDNDCDGEVDEDLGTSSCGLGICEHTIANCIQGVPQVCDPKQGAMPEMCDTVDNDCDGEVDEGYADLNDNGKPDCIDPDDDGDGDPDITDCAPLDAAVHHQAQETCDGIDNNCGGGIDEEGAQGCEAYYKDADSDSHGTQESKCLCGPTGFYKGITDDDCNDANPWVFPGATELCDKVDNNCDEEIDEDGATGCSWFFADADADGYGSGEPECVCTAPGTGYSVLAGDCDEEQSAIHPGALELCDNKDNDCDDEIDETFDLETDAKNCGECGFLCQPDNAFGKCLGGDCEIDGCKPGFGNCNNISSDGCEKNTDQDPEHCGGCSEECELPHATAGCAAGKCTVVECDEHFANDDGVADTGCETVTYGQSADNPGELCKHIKDLVPEAEDGVYWIDPDGPGGNGAFQAFCEMTTDGGGWTYVMHINNNYDGGGNPMGNKTGTYKTDRSDGNATYSLGILDEIADSEMMVTVDTPDPVAALAASKFIIFKYDPNSPGGFNHGPHPCSGGFNNYHFKLSPDAAWTTGNGGSCDNNHWFPKHPNGNNLLGSHIGGSYGNYWGVGMGGNNTHYHDGYHYVR